MDEVLISATTSHFPPAIGSNGGSDFVVVWDAPLNTELRGRRLLASGVTSGDEFPINTTTEGTHSRPVVALLGGVAPGFVVAWIAEATGARNVLLQRFAPDGTRTGVEIRANTTQVNPSFRPAIARLPDLNFVVSWVSGDLDGGIRAQIFEPSGTRLGDEFRVDTSDGVHIGPVLLAPLENNSFVVAWQGGGSLASTTAHLQIFEPDGSRLGPETIPNFVGFTGEMAMTFISNPQLSAEPGHFVMAHISSAGGGEERIVEASLFGPDADLRSTFNVTQRDDQSIARELAVAALPGQRFVVAWTDRKVPHVGDTTGENIKAMLCSETQGALIQSDVPAIQVSTTTAGDQTVPCVATIVGGEQGEAIAVAWVDDSVSGSGASVRAVKARVLPASGGIA